MVGVGSMLNRQYGDQKISELLQLVAKVCKYQVNSFF